MITIATLRAAGLTEAQVLRVVEIEQRERIEQKREAAKIRARNYRARHASERDVTLLRRDARYARDAVSPLPTTTITSTVSQEERSEIVAPEVNEFAVFWNRYPHKVGKRAAATAFERARRRAAFDIITAGLARYAAKTDDRPWCNPATWLNQDRWEDQEGPSQEGKPKAAAAQPCRLAYAASWEERSRKQLEEREMMERGRR